MKFLQITLAIIGMWMSGYGIYLADANGHTLAIIGFYTAMVLFAYTAWYWGTK